jgi:type I restriction enzyme S subunit
VSAWKRVPLGDFAKSVEYGVTAASTLRPVGPKFLRITDIQDGAVNWDTVPWCECDARSVKDSRLQAGDIVFARTGATTGKSFLIRDCPPDAVFASYLIRVRVGQEADPRYVSHFFQTRDYWAQITKGARGVAQPGVNATTLRAIQVPLPPLPQQERIAEVLDRADALRARRRAALAQLDTLTEAIFLDLFGDPITNPKEWPDSKSLGEIADIVSGVTKGRDLRGERVREVPYLAVVNVQDRSLNLSVVKTIEATEDEIQRYKLMANDLLLTEGGDPDKLGRGTLWSDELPECIHQNHIFRVRITSPEVDPLFLNWLVGSQRGKRFFLRSAKQTTGIASINMTQLRSFPMLFPPLTLQHKFAGLVAAAEKLKNTYRASVAELNTLFASLEQRAFRGEL